MVINYQMEIENRLALPKLTAIQLLSWGLPEETGRFIPRDWSGTVVDFLRIDPLEIAGIKRYDLLLIAALQNESYPNEEFAWKALRIFACDCAERALKRFMGAGIHDRCLKAIKVSRHYAEDKVSIVELAAAYSQVKKVYLEAKAADDAENQAAEDMSYLRAAYAGVDPVDYGPADAYAAARIAVRAFATCTADYAPTDAYAATRTKVRLHAVNAARAACDALADAKTASAASANAARADFHPTVYLAACVDAVEAAEAAMDITAEIRYISVISSPTPMRDADSVDNAKIHLAAEEAYTSAFTAAYNRIRSNLDTDERRWQVDRLRTLIEKIVSNEL